MTSAAVDQLAPARAAIEAGDWHAALAALGGPGPSGSQDPGHLELVAVAAYGAGHFESAITAWERLHQIERDRGQHVAAARAASMVAVYLLMDTGLMAPVRAWLARTDRLLTDQGETPVHAMVAMVRAYERFMCGDMAGAAPWGTRAVELGDRHGVVPASTLGRVVAARLRIFAGDVDVGLAGLQEVADLLMSGEVDPLTAGMVWCELVCAVQGLARHDIAQEWTLAMDARRRQGDFFGGINGRCRVHRAELLRLRGACEEAEAEATHACEELRPWMRREFGWPLTELGTIRLRRGDLAGAEEAFLSAHAGGWDAQPGLSLLRLSQGDAVAAASLISNALEHPLRIPWKERPPDVALTRAPLLEAQVEIALEVGDVATASAAAQELAVTARTFRSAALQASAALAGGRVALAHGDGAAAVERCRQAIEGWCAVEAPYEAAAARLALARAHEACGEPDLAALEVAAARVALADIGAVHRALPPATTPRGSASPAAAEGPVSAAPPPADALPAVFRCDGDTRTITFVDRTVLMRDLKGMRYIARLLAEPGREFHALDLTTAESGAPTDRAVATVQDGLTVTSDGAGPMLDDQAREAYRRQLQDVEEDIAEAEAMGDLERAALARSDRDYLVAELSRAFGLDGRPRTAASASERARGSVTRAVRYAVARIGDQHPELAEHLERTVHTGVYCSYTPDPLLPLSWHT